MVMDNELRSVVEIAADVAAACFVGNHYELSNGVVTKHYFAGAQRIAIPQDIGTM